MDIKIKRREVLIYTALFLYCSGLFFKRVELPFDAEMILNKCMTLGAILAVFNILLDKNMSIKQWFVFVVISGGLYIDSMPTGNHELLYLFFVIWTCRNTDKKCVMKYIWFMTLIYAVLILLLTLAGILHNEKNIMDEWRVRYGLGYNVWSILPFQYMSLSLYYLYFKHKKVSLISVLVVVLGAIPIFLLTDTKSALAFTCFGAAVMMLLEYIKRIRWNKIGFIRVLPVLAAVASYAMAFFYLKGSSFLVKVDQIMNHRIYFSALALYNSGINWFANPNIYEGYDGTYFGIDNNYMNLLLVWGIIALIVVCYLYSMVIKRCIELHDKKLLFMVLFSLFVGITWSRMLVLIEAEFLVCFSSVFETKKKSNTDNDKELIDLQGV